MIFGRLIVALAVIFALSAQARDLGVDNAVVHACFEQSVEFRGLAPCVQDAANACQQLPYGDDTLGITQCLMLEAAVWDELMETEFDTLRARLAAAEQESEMARQLDAVASLDAAQAEWRSYRDAECNFRRAYYGMGSMQSVEAAVCWLELTALRASQMISKRPR